MHLHEELRAARQAAGLTQTELAMRSGIPRNQVVRAEKGGNITLDTLRKIAIHLPLEHLTLLEKLKLDVDYVPEPEKVYQAALTNVTQTLEALLAAVAVARATSVTLASARRLDPDSAPDTDDQADELVVLKEIGRVAEGIATRLKGASVTVEG